MAPGYARESESLLRRGRDFSDGTGPGLLPPIPASSDDSAPRVPKRQRVERGSARSKLVRSPIFVAVGAVGQHRPALALDPQIRREAEPASTDHWPQRSQPGDESGRCVIAFSRPLAGARRLFVMDADGTGTPRDLGVASKPCWSPEGIHLVTVMGTGPIVVFMGGARARTVGRRDQTHGALMAALRRCSGPGLPVTGRGRRLTASCSSAR
jgi:hypothetical protein